MNQEKSFKKTKIVWKGFIIRIIILFFIGIFSYVGYFGYKIYKLEKQVVQEDIENENQDDQNQSTIIQAAKDIITNNKKELRGEEKERINILLVGMGGEGHSGKYLTDTIMLVSINPKTYQSAFLSIPRDLYVNVPNSQIFTKINAVYAYGLRNNGKNSAESFNDLKKVVAQVTGQEVDYYISLDFDGFKKIIDELNGLNIEVTEDIYDSRYPGPNFSYETFEIKKGQHHMDGETALKYARVRHNAGGDFGRAARQQEILASAKRKAFSIEGFINPIHLNGLIDILGEHLRTDIHLDEIPSFINLITNINIFETTNKVLDAWSEDSLLASSHVPLGGVMAYILISRTKNYNQIYELAENIFDLKMLERKKEEIKKEKASILVLSQDGKDYYKIQNIFQKLGYRIEIKENRFESITCQEKAKIFNNSQNPKVFTLDDLSAKLEGEVVDKKIEGIDENIVICMPENLFDYFQLQNEKEEENDDLKEQSIINKDGEVLINSK